LGARKKKKAVKKLQELKAVEKAVNIFWKVNTIAWDLYDMRLDQNRLMGFCWLKWNLFAFTCNAIHRHRFDEIVSCQKWYLFQDFVHLLVVVGRHPPGFVMHFHIRGPENRGLGMMVLSSFF